MGATTSRPTLEFLDKDYILQIVKSRTRNEQVWLFEKLKEMYEMTTGSSFYKITYPFYDHHTRDSSSSSPFSLTLVTDPLIKQLYVDVCKSSNREQLIRNFELSRLPSVFETMTSEKFLSLVNLDYMVGAGMYGAVCLGTLKENNQKVAIKFMQTQSIQARKAYTIPYFYLNDEMFLTECYVSNICSKLPVDFFSKINVFSQVTGVNLNVKSTDPKIRDVLQKKSTYIYSSFAMIMEPFQDTYYGYLSLKKNTMSQEKKKLLYVQALYAIYYFNKYLLAIHRDIHTNNIMLMDCEEFDDIDPDLDSGAREYPFKDNNLKLTIRSPFRLCLMDFGFAVSDVLMGKHTSSKFYQAQLELLASFSPFCIPMHIFDIYKFIRSARMKEDFVFLVNYIRFFHQKTILKIFPRFGEKGTATSYVDNYEFDQDIKQIDSSVSTLTTIMLKTGFLPYDFRYHSSKIAEYLIEKNAPPGSIRENTADRRRKEEKEKEEGVYTRFELENGLDEFDFSRPVCEQFGNLLNRNSFPTHPIQLVNKQAWDENKETILERITKYFEDPHILSFEYLESLLFLTFEKYGYPTKFVGNYESMAVLCKLQDKERKISLRKSAFESEDVYNKLTIYLTYVIDSIEMADFNHSVLESEDLMFIRFFKQDGGKYPSASTILERSNRLFGGEKEKKREWEKREQVLKL